MAGLRIRSAANTSDEPGLRVFVSEYANENGSIACAGFETVVSRNRWGKTRAFYLHVPEGQIFDVTFFGMDLDISIHYVKAHSPLAN